MKGWYIHPYQYRLRELLPINSQGEPSIMAPGWRLLKYGVPNPVYSTIVIGGYALAYLPYFQDNPIEAQHHAMVLQPYSMGPGRFVV